MEKTRYEGVMYKINRRGNKVYYARFKVNNKAYLRKIGEEPQVNAKTASALRFKMIDTVRGGDVGKAKSMDAIFEEYVKLRSPTLSESWEYNMTKTYNKHLKDIVGHLLPEQVKPNALQKRINELIANGYAPSTAKQLKDCIGGMYTHMLKGRENVGHMLSIPKFDNKVYFTISDDDAKKLYREIVNFDVMKWRVFFSFLLHGRRRGEVMKLKWDDIHLDEGYYIIEPENSKTNKRIKAPLLPFLSDMLREYAKNGNSGYVVKGRYGKMVSKSSVDGAWTKIKYSVGLKSMRLHDLRHLIGHIAVNNGATLEEIAMILGHDSTTTTKRYSNLVIDTAKRTLERVHEQIN